MSDVDFHSKRNGPYFTINAWYPKDQTVSGEIILDGALDMIKLRNFLDRLIAQCYPDQVPKEGEKVKPID